MNIKHFHIVALLLICLLTVFACTKEKAIVENENVVDSQVDLRAKDYNLDLPQVVDDRYVFRDLDHLTNYYQALDKILTSDDQEFDTLIYQNRRGVNTVHHKLVNDEFVNPNDRYKPFLTDPIMSVIVNEYFEFQVDDLLITYMNNTDILTCESSDYETRGKIRNITKGVEINFFTIPDKAYWGRDTNSDDFVRRKWCACKIDVQQISCDQVKVSGQCKNLIGGKGKGHLVVYYSNTNLFPSAENNYGIEPEPVFAVDVNGGFSYVFDIPTNAPIFIHARANSKCGESDQKSIEFDFDSSCDYSERDVRDWVELNSRAMDCKASYYVNYINAYEQAEIWSYNWVRNKWRKRRGQLTVTLESKTRNQYCNSYGGTSSSKSCYCRHKRVRNKILYVVAEHIRHCDNDVNGFYERLWLEASNSVDFDCCE